jgi:hypothetical protein
MIESLVTDGHPFHTRHNDVTMSVLSDDGSLPPKHVGGNIICMYLTYFVCASSWFFNKCLSHRGRTGNRVMYKSQHCKVNQYHVIYHFGYVLTLKLIQKQTGDIMLPTSFYAVPYKYHKVNTVQMSICIELVT